MDLGGVIHEATVFASQLHPAWMVCLKVQQVRPPAFLSVTFRFLGRNRTIMGHSDAYTIRWDFGKVPRLPNYRSDQSNRGIGGGVPPDGARTQNPVFIGGVSDLRMRSEMPVRENEFPLKTRIHFVWTVEFGHDSNGCLDTFPFSIQWY